MSDVNSNQSGLILPKSMSQKIAENIAAEQAASEAARERDVKTFTRGINRGGGGKDRRAAHVGQRPKALAKRRAAKKAARR